MLLLLLLLSTFSIVSCSCPKGFELVREGECRGVYVDAYPAAPDRAIGYVGEKCVEIQGQPVIIHNDEHQSYLRGRMHYPPVLGLTCNTRTMRWEWVDGSAIDYKPHVGYDFELDYECGAGCMWVMQRNGHWNHYCGNLESKTVDVWCTTTLPPAAAKECDHFNDDSEDSACYQIGAIAEDFRDAQNICRNFGATLATIHNQQENSFIRRLAVSKGTLNGLYLGATLSGKGDGFGWIDGSDWDYENYFPGFPVEGLGECLSMDTMGVAGQWMNMNCSAKLAVACVRQPNASSAAACSHGPWFEGQLIYSPGYPYDASIPCDYSFSVDAGKKVEVKVHQLQANSCCDHLVLYDGFDGGHIVANLTGEVLEKGYTAKSSNVRVSWQPNGGINVRGMMISYRGV